MLPIMSGYRGMFQWFNNEPEYNKKYLKTKEMLWRKNQ